MMEKMELRTYTSEMVFDSEGELKIEGLVNGTETWSHVLGNRKKFVEKINKGAFLRALSRGKSFDFLSEHDKNFLLATTDNGSLELWEDEEGLKMRANIVPTSYGKDIYTLIKNRVVNHMSFGFRVLKDTWEKGVDGIHRRSIEELDLIEVSAVRNPAYPCSAIAARNIELIEDVDIPEIEEVKEEQEERMRPEDINTIVDMLMARLSEKKSEETPIITEEPVKEEIPVAPVEEVKEEIVEDPKVEEEIKVETEEKVEEDAKEESTPENDFDVTQYLEAIKENQKNRI